VFPSVAVPVPGLLISSGGQGGFGPSQAAAAAAANTGLTGRAPGPY